jgi:RNA polymerase sigma factor (sigma-70 family)
MATGPMTEFLQHLRGAMLRGDQAGLTDGQLLECFLSRRDDAALAALVRRHGPMVWGVCRRAVPDYHDAEDAFQAVFLVLVRRAASVVPRERVASWLHGVAYQTARKARATAARRRARERQVSTMPEPLSRPHDLWHDLRPVLDEELNRLPDRYRAVLLLCDLEGRTRREAARQLGVPEGTVMGWLARARLALAKRLARHGLAVSGGALAAVLAERAASGVPPAVVSNAIQVAGLAAEGTAVPVRAAALAEGVSRAMVLTRIKVITAGLLLIGILGIGVALRPLAARMPTPEAGPEPVAQPWQADVVRKPEPPDPDLGFYPPSLRLIRAAQGQAIRKEPKAREARRKTFAKLQAIAEIEANLKKLTDATDDRAEREALDRIARAVRWYQDARYLAELRRIEEEAVPFPGGRDTQSPTKKKKD